MDLFMHPFLTILCDKLNKYHPFLTEWLLEYKPLLQLGGKNIPTCILSPCLNLFSILPGTALFHVSYGTCSISTSGNC